MAGRLRTEILSKTVHVLIGLLLVLAFRVKLLTPEILGLVIVLFGLVVVYNYKYERELLTKILSISRADTNVAGVDILAYLISTLLVFLILPEDLASAAVLILAFGDPIAHLVSTGLGDAALTKSSYMQGTIAGILIGAVAAWNYVDFIYALIASAAAMFVAAGELRIAKHYIDDNFTIPIVAGAVLWLITYVVH